MHELLAVGGAQLAGDCALEGLGGAGAVQGVRSARGGASTGRNERRTEDISENAQGQSAPVLGHENAHGKPPSGATWRVLGRGGHGHSRRQQGL